MKPTPKAGRLFPLFLTILFSILLGDLPGTAKEVIAGEDIDRLFDQIYWESLANSPETLSQLKLDAPEFLAGYDARLTDFSEAALDKEQAWRLETRKELQAIDTSALTAGQRNSLSVILWDLTSKIELDGFRHHAYLFNQFTGLQNVFLQIMTDVHSVSSVQDAENYIARLAASEAYFGDGIAFVRRAEELGITPPGFAVQMVAEQAGGIAKMPMDQNLILLDFTEKVGALADLPEAERQRLIVAAQDELAETVIPAYEMVAAHFSGLAERARPDVGVWALPDGKEYYELMVQSMTGLENSADEIHQMGIDTAATIKARQLDVWGRMGIDISEGYAAAQRNLFAGGPPNGPEFRYEISEGTYGDVLADYESIIGETDMRLEGLFRMRPKAGLTVKRIPEFMENGARGGYYQLPSRDGSVPGAVFINLRNLQGVFKPSMHRMAQHEGIPGHHFQLALQQESEQLTLYQKAFILSGFVEGWAVYSEQLMAENGYYDDKLWPEAALLGLQLHMAGRMVADTGLHYKGWSMEKAAEEFSKIAGGPPRAMMRALTNYAVAPAQAVGYMLGANAFRRLRTKAETAMGDKFDIMDFHDIVLQGGNRPFSVLEGDIDKYIARDLD